MNSTLLPFSHTHFVSHILELHADSSYYIYMQTIFFIQLFVNAVYIPLFINTPWKTTNALLFRSGRLFELSFLYAEFYLSYAETNNSYACIYDIETPVRCSHHCSSL